MRQFFKYKLKYRVNTKIFISFIFIILVTSVTSLLISYWLFKDSIEKASIVRLEDSILAYYNEIQLIKETCLTAVSALAKDSSIAALVSQGNRTYLGQILSNYYRMGLFDIVEILDKDGSVFIRAHDPEEKGDFKIDQHIIQRGLAGETVVSFEGGRSGIAIRAVAPLEKDGNIVGLLMLGRLFSEKFAENMKRLTGLNNGIYWGNMKIISTFDDILQTIDDNKMAKLLKNGYVMFHKKINNDRYHFMIKALYTDDQHYWGAILLFLREESNARYLSYIKMVLFFMLTIGFFLSLRVYLFLAADINNSLSKIIDGIDKLDINSGLQTQIIDIKANDEFKIIAESINALSRKIYKYNQEIILMQTNMIESAKLAVAGQLSAGLAHEIKNPLSSIKMMSQIIKSRHLKDENGLDEINTVLEQVDRIDKLVKDLLEFSKPRPMSFSSCDINELVLDIVTTVSKIGHKNITIECELADNLPFLSVDSEKIKICFINFAVNAIQAMPEGGKLIITTLLQSDKINIEFKNNGPAIAQRNIGKIFEPFFTTKEQGSGLGLAISKLIIERHHGTIDFSSNEQETVFKVILPMEKNISE
ncbi:MAG: ATP-binding protein [Spirochaetes bacterium]|nr:ATP-binding protein [Spirochaetota bacterium]